MKIEKQNNSVILVVLALVVGLCILFKSIADIPEQEILSPLAPTPTLIPTPKPLSWNNAIRVIFPKDEAGKMIRICLKESGNKYAVHYNTNGTFDYGWCQINSIHKPKRMNESGWKLYLENPENHAKETRRIFLSQGWNAWVVNWSM